ncbi:hypothetical protein MSG28_002680 [Choristoneura fumiferana]|uniref:Uncharacterized protein n=1 Tax=Choristoneura fumiferana TaxID=7141 RepID=A0ACC0JIU9_CHOFU|nr:hypothetical protein MSG28_002680 [Choristoneura fumiferana]
MKPRSVNESGPVLMALRMAAAGPHAHAAHAHAEGGGGRRCQERSLRGLRSGYRYQKIWGSERFDRWCYWSSRRATGEYCVKGKATTTTEFTPLLLENRIINVNKLAVLFAAGTFWP